MREIELRLWRQFAMLAEELHFGRAATRLHMTQPPLSQQIREFEKSAGALLFLRTTRSVQLTPAGALMLERARQLVADADRAVHASRQLASGETGSLTLGFTHSTVYRVLPRVLAAFREHAPGITLEFKQHTSNILVDGLRAGRIDVVLARLSPAMMEDFEVSVMARDPMVVLMPAGHALARHASVTAKALEGVPFIDYSSDGARYFKELVDAILAAAKVRPQITYTSFLPTLFALVEAGMGVALVPKSAADSLNGAFVSRPLSMPRKVSESVLYSAWRRDSANPAVAAFAAMRPALVKALGTPG